MAKKKDWMKMTLMFILALGAVNWGLVGAFEFNLLETLFGRWMTFLRVLYGVVGVVGLKGLWDLYKMW